MNERVTRLRQRSLDTVAYISAERAELLTEFYRLTRSSSVPAQRALAFNYILKHKEICINEGELIVGERGPAPKATYTYPELCCHSLEDLDIL
ncbi:MAG TPA: pyruvate formate lyase family protein, partial [Desulfosporosinus sp.]|nr:pyruvate formate lyase family protein [Desulfosporosinus sp.]